MTTLKSDTLELALLKGKFVFIVFWDSGCQPCLKELPHLIQMAELFPADKLQVIGLARDDEKALRKYLEKNPLPYPNAIADSSILKAWKVDQFPGSFLINPEGKVIARDFRGQKTMVKVGQLIAEYFEKHLSSSHLNR